MTVRGDSHPVCLRPVACLGDANPDRVRANPSGYSGGSIPGEDGAYGKTSRFSPEVRERAVRPVLPMRRSIRRSGRRFARSLPRWVFV